MAGQLLNFHVANTSSLILLSYYLLKSMVHLCCSRPNVGQDPGAALPWPSYGWCTLSSVPLRPGSYCFPHIVVLPPPSSHGPLARES